MTKNKTDIGEDSSSLEHKINQVIKTLADRAVDDIELSLAIGSEINDHEVVIDKYKIQITPKTFAGTIKNFYNIIDITTQEIIHRDLALFETALALLKKYIKNNINGIDELELFDLEYNNALYEVYVYKQKFKNYQDDISIAKIDNAKRRMSSAKLKIIKKLW